MQILKHCTSNNQYSFTTRKRVFVYKPKRRKNNVFNGVTQVITMRTHVLADFIEKFNNDIVICDSTECNSYSDDFECKYIAFLRLILIVVILMFMFIDYDGNKKDNNDNFDG